MKRLVLFLPILLLSTGALAQAHFCLPDGISQDRAFHALTTHFSDIARQQLEFKSVNVDDASRKLSTEERTFKLNRRHSVIGEFPELHRPKWQKEKLKLVASLDNGKISVALQANAYNKRDKQWHPLKSTGTYEELVLEGTLTDMVEGLTGWTMGTPVATGPHGNMKMENLQHCTVTGAYLTMTDIKSLVINLTDDKNVSYSISVPYLGDVTGISEAMNMFFAKFNLTDPRKHVQPKYSFYWAYAVHGDIMDGMHRQQVLVALGAPASKQKLDAHNEVWLYDQAGSTLKLNFHDGDLTLPDQ